MTASQSDIRQQLAQAFPGLSADDAAVARMFDRVQLVKLDRERFVFRSGDLCNALLSLVFVGPQTNWGWIGVVPLVTGIIGNCPVYSLFGISTCSVKQ